MCVGRPIWVGAVLAPLRRVRIHILSFLSPEVVYACSAVIPSEAAETFIGPLWSGRPSRQPRRHRRPFFSFSSSHRHKEHAAGVIEHGPPQAIARRRRRGAGAEPLLRGGWDGAHSKAHAQKRRSQQIAPVGQAGEILYYGRNRLFCFDAGRRAKLHLAPSPSPRRRRPVRHVGNRDQVGRHRNELRPRPS